MKVRELLDALRVCDPEAEVHIETGGRAKARATNNELRVGPAHMVFGRASASGVTITTETV